MENIVAVWCAEPLPLRVAVGLFVAYGISMGLAELLVGRFKSWAGKKLPKITEPLKDAEVPPEITGRVERLGFTAIVIVQPTLALPAMGGWLALKMAATWNKNIWPDNDKDVAEKRVLWNRHAFLGLLAGFVSMGFAWAGGMLGRALMCLEP